MSKVLFNLQRQKLFYLLVLFFAFSCIGEGNKQAINLYYDDLKLGESAFEILKNYGLSSHRWEDEEGNNIISYSYSRSKYNILSFLPWQKSNSKFVNYEVVMTFNQEAKLVKIKKFSNELKVKSWLLCDNNVTNCFSDSEITKEDRIMK